MAFMEEEGRKEALESYKRREEKTRLFHGELAKFYAFLETNCKHMLHPPCECSPKLICCLESYSKGPPSSIKCGLYHKGLFPLLVDSEFIHDVTEDEKSSLVITENHGKRFMKEAEHLNIRRRPPAKGVSPESQRKSSCSDATIE